MVRRKASLAILECISERKEGLAEGQLLWELLRILGCDDRSNIKIIRGANRLIEELEDVQEQYLHISAHGRCHKTRGTYLKTPRKGKVYAQDLAGLWEGKKKSGIPRLVVLSACEAGRMDMVRAFSDAGCRYFIGPLYDTYFEDAAVFLTLFYKLLLGEKRSPWIAFKNTKLGLSLSLPELSGAWGFYEWGEKCHIESAV